MLKFVVSIKYVYKTIKNTEQMKQKDIKDLNSHDNRSIWFIL